MARAAVILLREQQVALIERRVEGQIYYHFPGGSVETHELVAEVSFRGDVQHYFRATVAGGEFGTGQGTELLGGYPPEKGTYTPCWLPVGELHEKTIYPLAVAQIVAAAAKGSWPERTQHIEDHGGSFTVLA